MDKTTKTEQIFGGGLYNQLQRLIDAGRTQGMDDKLSIMLGYDMLTVEEYNTLMQKTRGEQPNG